MYVVTSDDGLERETVKTRSVPSYSVASLIAGKISIEPSSVAVVLLPAGSTPVACAV